MASRGGGRGGARGACARLLPCVRWWFGCGLDKVGLRFRLRGLGSQDRTDVSLGFRLRGLGSQDRTPLVCTGVGVMRCVVATDAD